MDAKTIIIVILSASLASYFIPTPFELQTAFKSGQDFYASKDYRRAVEQYDKILETESSFLEAESVRVSLLNDELNVGVKTASYYQKANALRNMSKKDESIEAYRIVEQRKDSPKLASLAQFQIYEMYYADKKYEDAIREARVLIDRHSLDEKIPRAWYDIGWAFRERGMIDSSDVAFEMLLKLYPENELDARTRYQLAQNYFDQEQWDKAIQAYTGLTEKYRPEAFVSTEWENVELKAVRDRKIFEAQAGKDADATTLELVAKAQVRIGDCYEKKNQYEAAMQTYRAVITRFALMPTLVEATYIKMAEYTSRLKGIEDGVAVYRRAIDENFKNKQLQAKLQYKVARTYQDSKVFEKAALEYLFYVSAYGAQADQIRFPSEQAYFLAISNFYNARNYKETIAYVDTAVSKFPQTEYLGKLYMYKGLSHLALAQFAGARQYFTLVVQVAPGSNEAVLAEVQLGKSYFDERKYSEAVASFEKLLAGDLSRLDVGEVRYLLGSSYYGLAEYEKAISNLETVDRASPYFPYTFARITRAYTARQQYDEAAAYLDKAFAAARTDSVDFSPFVRLARSELYAAQQNYDLAISEFDTVIADSSLVENTRVQALYGRGMIRYETGKYQEAVADLQACLKSGVFVQAFPSLVPQAKERLAFSFATLGKKKEGAELLQGLVASAVSEAEKSRFLAMTSEFYYRAGDYAKAVEIGNQVLGMPDTEEQARIRTYVTLSNCYGNLQQHAKAIETLKEASEKFPSNSFIEEVFYQLGMIYYNGGDYRSAADAFGAHFQKFPESKYREEAFYHLAFSEYQMGKADESIGRFRDFLKRFPSSPRAPEVQMQIGEAYFNTNRFELAAKEYQGTYRLYPQNENAATAMFNEGWCYFQLQESQQMIQMFRTLIHKYPATRVAADAQFTIGDYYYNVKSHDSALIAYKLFVEKFPTDPRFEEAKGLMKELGEVEAFREYEGAMAYFEAKNWKLAIQELTGVMNKYSETSIVYGCKTNIASSHAQLGERKRALALFDEIIAEWKDVEDARTAVFFAGQHKRWIEAGK